MTTVMVQDNKTNLVANLDSKKDLIKRLYCKGATDDELELFMHSCNRTGLDPMLKQIYAIKRGPTMTIQTGIDGLRLIAERTGNYSPGRESTFTYDDKGFLQSATSYIKKRTADGTWHEVAAVAYMDEYNAKQNLWNKMPRVMLSKCAESTALRKAFPAEMSGLYTSEEMDQATPHIIEERSEVSDEEWAKLDTLVQEINDEAYKKKLEDFIKVPSLYDIQPKDYDRVMRSLEKKCKEKISESNAVA